MEITYLTVSGSGPVLVRVRGISTKTGLVQNIAMLVPSEDAETPQAMTAYVARIACLVP